MAKVYGGRWETTDSLDEGGQAHAFIVKDKTESENALCVLKRLKNQNRIGRFKDEIEAVRTLVHPNLVRLIDFNLEEHEPYLVTEYCDGGSLAKANPVWYSDPATAFMLFEQVCVAVEYAHARKIVHRDLKPQNIFLRGEDRAAVVGDFGLCYFLDDGTRLTLTDEAVGSRNFMSPESEDGRASEITSKCDIYSLGKILYWLLSGGNTFSREKHRDPDRDLRGRSDDPVAKWKNIYMEHANRLLDLMIVNDPDKRSDLNNILPMLRQTSRLIQKEFVPIARDINPPCSYCGQGYYLKQVSDRTQVENFGFMSRGIADWRILVCNVCGHVELFRIDMSQRKDWWQ